MTMATECTRCGDCCEDIHIRVGPREYLEAIVDWALSPPRSDDERAQWRAGQRDNDLTYRFIVEHWHLTGRDGNSAVFECDQFDPTTRTCMAHDDRPPICSGFPWYGKAPHPDKAMTSRCSFWADVDEDQRPDDWVPVVSPKRRDTARLV